MPNILVIDDSQTIIAGLRRYLGQHGYEVFAPERFVDIHRMIAEHSPEMIILDLNMPSLSGEQVGNFLRKNAYRGQIIVYSGEATAKLAAVAETIGAHAFVPKDAPLEDLLAAIQQVAPQAAALA